ncbi:MFS transporter [Streptomyces sp. NPDC002920]
MPSPGTSLSYARVLRLPHASRTFAAALVGRLAYGIVPLSVTLAVTRATGSYTVAGTVMALFGGAAVFLSPARAALVDRYGPRRALVPLTVAHVAFLLLLAAALAAPALPAAPAMGALAGAAGACAPPLGPTMRAVWGRIAPDRSLLQRAYSLDGVAEELLFVTGPLLVGTLIGFAPPTAGIVLGAALMTTGVTGFVSSPAIREATPGKPAGARRERGGPRGLGRREGGGPGGLRREGGSPGGLRREGGGLRGPWRRDGGGLVGLRRTGGGLRGYWRRDGRGLWGFWRRDGRGLWGFWRRDGRGLGGLRREWGGPGGLRREGGGLGGFWRLGKGGLRAPRRREVGGLRGLGRPVAAVGGVGLALGAVALLVVAFSERRGYDGSGVAWVMAALSAGSAVGGLLNGALDWRAPAGARLPLLTAGLGLAVCGAGLAPNLGTLALACAAAGFFVSPAITTAYLMADETAAPAARVRAGAWVNTAVNAGSTTGTAAAGALAGRLPVGLCFGATGVAVLLTAAAVAGRARRGAGTATRGTSDVVPLA